MHSHDLEAQRESKRSTANRSEANASSVLNDAPSERCAGKAPPISTKDLGRMLAMAMSDTELVISPHASLRR